jgi:hypothetical protein
VDNTLALNFIGASGGKLKLVGDVFAGKDLAIAVCKNIPSLPGRTNRDLAAVTAYGELEKTINLWTTKPV